MGENRNFILLVVAILCFVIIAGILFVQNSSLSKQLNLGLQTLMVNQQNDITAVNNKINALEEKLSRPAEKNSQIIYENRDYGIRFVNSDKCDKDYLMVKENDSQSISVFVPGNKSWVENSGNAAWVGYQIMSLDDYNKMEADPINGKPEIVLSLKNNYLLTKGPVQDGPEIPGSCSWEVENI